MSKSNTATKDDGQSGTQASDQTAAPKKDGPSSTDKEIAAGTLIGGISTTLLAGVSAYPILKDVGTGLWNGAQKLLGDAEDAGKTITSAMKKTFDNAFNALSAIGLDKDGVDTVMRGVEKLGKGAKAADIVPIIENALEAAGESNVSKDLVKSAAKMMEEAVEVLV